MAYHPHLHQAAMAARTVSDQIATLYRLDDIPPGQIERAVEQLEIALVAIRQHTATPAKTYADGIREAVQALTDWADEAAA